MSEIDSKPKSELNTRKEILNQHLAKFNQLKNECKWSEAWQQLLVTLNYANETLKYSSNLLKSLSQKMPQLSPEQQKKVAALTDSASKIDLGGEKKPQQKKMIVIPKKQTIN